MSGKIAMQKGRRPATARLVRPQLLDPSWSLQIDMTTIKLSSLEEVEAILTKPRKTRGGVQNVNRCNNDDDEDDGGNNKNGDVKKKKEDVLSKKMRRRLVPGLIDGSGKRSPKTTPLQMLCEEVAGQVPSPCQACSKNDEPERFHSHPKTASSINQNRLGTVAHIVSGHNFVESPKKTVTKPVPLKFKSGKSKGKPSGTNSKLTADKLKETSQTVSTAKTLPAKLNHKKISSVPCSKCGKQVVSNLVDAHERICRGKPDVVRRPVNLKMAYDTTLLFCKKCGKTFGENQALLESHVESCDIKWTDLDEQIENYRLGLKTGDDEQYEQYKEKLVPCPICSRKFSPSRIQTHESACRKVHNTNRLK